MSDAQALADSFGRIHNYVRISVTERCNLSCEYCRPDQAGAASSPEPLTFDEIASVVAVLADMGVTKVRLTGGEPLLRPRLEELVARLHAVNGIERIGLTTNGMLLASKARVLREAGLTDVNISLDSLLPERFARITGGGDVGKVLHAIGSSLDAGFKRVKVNMVVMQGVNDDEIESFLQLTLKYPLDIRFIEYMPIGRGTEGWQAGYMPLSGILERCSRAGWAFEPVSSDDPGHGAAHEHDLTMNTTDSGPARYYRIEGAAGQFGLIDPVSRHFCMSCNRLRITASGHIKPCLYWNDEWNVKPYIGKAEQLKQLFLRSLENKPGRHEMPDGLKARGIVQPVQENTVRQMSQIGG
ncbi:GTP 3',8-cyclase MoaA [Paenibacillus jilunlii]|uniref:GTP 3',8-cyclase n=1 Tax=Paenibacillus jilunlii TaxID=682956 RepID=A0A1G9YIH6_9BACL|nr:GTP 3',8-cyclase MoaA [Paenibacillus jilunlii]KWX78803.1 molybdenum cofactor biosynthesis protein MoeA [Paenibacillus jilunlii]SDN08416.1 cyclic pyranopterin phosphate synthase [Paenibacillus jilunlii]